MTSTIVTVTMNPAVDASFEVERVVPEHKLRSTRPTFDPGGGGINVARVATRLGADAQAVWIGGGSEAETIAQRLTAESVPHRRVPAAGSPRLSFHVHERETGSLYRFVLPGPELTAADGMCMMEAIEGCAGASFVVISGSLPTSLPVDYYAQLALRVPAGARVVLDTAGEALDRGLAGHVYLAKPNRRELSRLVERELSSAADVVQAARGLIRAGRVEVVAVSMAADGLILVTATEDTRIAAPDVTPVSTVGAGDSTVAGIVVGLARGLSLGDAARLGIAAGTAAVLTSGTELCRPQDVERLFEQLQRSPG